MGKISGIKMSLVCAPRKISSILEERRNFASKRNIENPPETTLLERKEILVQAAVCPLDFGLLEYVTSAVSNTSRAKYARDYFLHVSLSHSPMSRYTTLV